MGRKVHLSFLLQIFLANSYKNDLVGVLVPSSKYHTFISFLETLILKSQERRQLLK